MGKGEKKKKNGYSCNLIVILLLTAAIGLLALAILAAPDSALEQAEKFCHEHGYDHVVRVGNSYFCIHQDDVLEVEEADD